MYDCIVVGGGPAGLTSAIYLARFLRRSLVIDAGGGRASLIPKTHNLAGFPDGISGTDLLARMRRQAEQYGTTLKDGMVLSITRHADGFLVDTGDETFATRTILLATGVVNHRPPLLPDEHDAGVARGLIRYCPICDAYEVRGKTIAVLGCSEHGASEASFIGRYSTNVTLLTQNVAELSHADEALLIRGNIEVIRLPLHSLTISDNHILVHLADGRSMTLDTLYVALGSSACSNLAKAIGARLSASGCIFIDEHQRTSIDGLFAAGDVVEGLDQIAVAMGQAAKAATAIHNRLSAA
jgi:thioredoxin reductase (NADPH)